MQREYQSLKEGKDRVSVAQLRKSERKSAGDDKRRTTEIDEKIKKTFHEEQEITFADFLKWKTETVIYFLKNILYLVVGWNRRLCIKFQKQVISAI